MLPIRDSFLRSLVSCRYETIDDDAKSKNPTCPLSLEAFQKDDSVNIMSCSHVFTGALLRKWLDKKDSCPLCRTKFFVAAWSDADDDDDDDDADGAYEVNEISGFHEMHEYEESYDHENENEEEAEYETEGDYDSSAVPSGASANVTLSFEESMLPLLLLRQQMQHVQYYQQQMQHVRYYQNRQQQRQQQQQQNQPQNLQVVRYYQNQQNQQNQQPRFVYNFIRNL